MRQANFSATMYAVSPPCTIVMEMTTAATYRTRQTAHGVSCCGGVCIWCVCVVCVYGVFVWCVYVVCLCGV